MKYLPIFTQVMCLIVIASPANAYIDPGSGSLAVQMLLGACVTASAVFAIYWRRILNFLGLRRRKDSPDYLAESNDADQ